jgi:hypothetical protein
MIWLLCFIVVYNVLQNLFHLAIIRGKSKIWHGLSAGIDTGLYLFLTLFAIYGKYQSFGWHDCLFVCFIGLSVRLVSRDMMIGVGTTSWMDQIFNGWYRLVLDFVLMFISAMMIYNYFTFI